MNNDSLNNDRITELNNAIKKIPGAIKIISSTLLSTVTASCVIENILYCFRPL